MKLLTSVCGVIVALSIVCMAAGQEKDAAKKEMEKLEGTWKVTESDGKVPGWVVDTRLTFKGDRVISKGKGRQESLPFVFRIDPTKKPKTIDLGVTKERNPDGKFATEGIYELEGDRLKMCISELHRPTEFKPKASGKVRVDGHVVITLKREKPSTSSP